MNKKLLFTLAVAGTLFSSTFYAADANVIARTILLWARWEQEINPAEMRGTSVSCVQSRLNTNLVVDHWDAYGEYAQCGAPFEKEGRSQNYIDNGPCKKQYQKVINFHEAMRAILEGCTVSTGEKKR